MAPPDPSTASGRSDPELDSRAQAPLWITWHPGGTHAWVCRGSSTQAPPAGAQTLRQSAEYFGLSYEEWRRHEGTLVDVPQLQARLAAAREREERPRDVFLWKGGWDWRVDSDSVDAVVGDASYGFSTGRNLVPCSRERLLRQCLAVRETPAVWIPESSTLKRPEDIVFLVEASRSRESARWRMHVGVALGVLVLVLVMAVTGAADLSSAWLGAGAGLSGAWALAACIEYLHVSRAGGALFREAREEHRYWGWVDTVDPLYTRGLLLLLFGLGLLQLFGPQGALEAAGLVKSAAAEGEVWRLVTGPLLHGGLPHLAVNLLALWGLGPLVEAHGGRGAVAIVFLTAALAGSLVSFILVPAGMAVGASGGILGLGGYLFALGWREPRLMPARFHERLGSGILATAVLGGFAYRIIDNAAHAGGLMAGVLLAFALPPLPRPEDALLSTREYVGILAWGILLTSGVTAIGRIMQASGGFGR